MNTLVLPITAVYAALCGMLVVILMLVVVQLRRTLKIGVGDGGNRDLLKAMRAHGNAVETVPVFLVLLGVFEANHGSAMMLHGCGAVFFLSRVLHAGGLFSSAGASFGRFVGIAGTVAAMLTLAVANLLKVVL